ncbi:hypothetical protein C5167_010029 [Papaver somniferum]|uniref:Uncharacterized protein n=1 Tax=Papaver somniferum TaxID=3469 RepID=A0A4Y7K319_PAPSO|nr:hypothetical protein C5167_010029 [Papaver somniferum]
MTVFKQKALLKKHNWTRTHIGNKEQLPTTTQFRPQDPEVGTSTTTTLQVSNSNGEHTPESSNAC